MSYKILVADDTVTIVTYLKDLLSKKGFYVIDSYDGEEALEKVRTENPDLVLLDLKMPKLDGLETLKRIRHFNVSLPVIILTGYNTLPEAIETVKWGITDCLSKPVDTKKLFNSINKALSSISKSRITELPYKDYNIDFLPKIMGESEAIKKVYELVKKVAPHNITVLIRGNSGTGKEIIARAIHYNSERFNNHLISVDCSALPENLVESELFGYEKGAFTGADKQKIGKFEIANKGTIFLDEIGNLPISTQVKLLRVLQEREIVRLGGNTSIKVDVRVIAATSTNLDEAIKRNTFREDLYHRLSEFTIFLPILKERKEDILFLMDLFLKEFNAEFNKRVIGFTNRVKELLCKYSWPGNVRELKNVVKSSIIVAEDFIEFKHLPLNIQVAVDERKEARPGDKLKEVIKRTTEEIERKMILQVLQDNNWNQLKTSKSLGIDPKTLYRKLKEYNIVKETLENEER